MKKKKEQAEAKVEAKVEEPKPVVEAPKPVVPQVAVAPRYSTYKKSIWSQFT